MIIANIDWYFVERTRSKSSQDNRLEKHCIESDSDLEPDEDLRASVTPSEGVNGNPSRSRRPRGAGRVNAPTYDHLPQGATREAFKEVFMPTVAKYLVKLETNVWSTNTTEYIRVIQAVWNQVFPKAAYTFSQFGSRCEVTRLVSFTCSWFVQCLPCCSQYSCRSPSEPMSGVANLHQLQSMLFSISKQATTTMKILNSVPIGYHGHWTRSVYLFCMQTPNPMILRYVLPYCSIFIFHLIVICWR